MLRLLREKLSEILGTTFWNIFQTDKLKGQLKDTRTKVSKNKNIRVYNTKNKHTKA